MCLSVKTTQGLQTRHPPKKGAKPLKSPTASKPALAAPVSQALLTALLAQEGGASLDSALTRALKTARDLDPAGRLWFCGRKAERVVTANGVLHTEPCEQVFRGRLLEVRRDRVRLPDGNGVEVCREVRSREPDVQCLILTSFSDDEALFQAIMAGAAGFLLKQIKGPDIVDAMIKSEVARWSEVIRKADIKLTTH